MGLFISLLSQIIREEAEETKNKKILKMSEAELKTTARNTLKNFWVKEIENEHNKKRNVPGSLREPQEHRD